MPARRMLANRVEWLGTDGFLSLDCRHERSSSEDLHRSFHVVGKYMQAHLGTHARQRLCQEVRRSHPRFEGAERMLDGLASYSGSARCSVESLLHSIEYVLVLPSTDAPIFTGRTLRFNRTARAS